MSGHARTFVKLTIDDYLRLEYYLRKNGEEHSPERYAALAYGRAVLYRWACGATKP